MNLKRGDYVRSLFHPDYGIGQLMRIHARATTAGMVTAWFIEWEYCKDEGYPHYASELIKISALEELAKTAE